MESRVYSRTLSFIGAKSRAALLATLVWFFPTASAYAPQVAIAAAVHRSFELKSMVADSNNEKSMEQIENQDDVAEIVQVLDGAYENAIEHATAKANSQASDFSLEDASIALSLRIASEITDGCTNASATKSSCLDHKSIDLDRISDILSYAASHLEEMDNSVTVNNKNIMQQTVRIRSLEHLYRMTLALMRAYLDYSQSAVYRDEAREQLRLAREQIEADQNVCACEPERFNSRKRELLQLDDQITRINHTSSRP